VPGTVTRNDGQSCIVTTLFGELLKFGAERNSFVKRLGSIFSSDGLGAHADTGPENSVSNPPSRIPGSSRIASTSVLTGSRISD
jgi:hypothetical protein